ncbi:MAG: glycosyltransferase family 2 protein [Pseudomonadota bacterium]
MNPTVSVVLPTFNRAQILPAAMRSVLDQDYRDLELIVVDDASTEDIEAVVKAVDDPRVRYMRMPHNGGAAAARNFGLQDVRGQYIAFQDSDDLWLPGKLTRQVELLEAQPPEVGVVTGLKILYGRDKGWVYGPGRVDCAPDPANRLKLSQDQVRHSLLENRISLQNALFRRDCMPDMVWFDPLAKANNDWEFVVRLVQHAKIYEVIEPVVYAAISDDSISMRPRKGLTGRLRIFRKNKHVFERYPREHGRFLYALAGALHKCGKKRLGRRVLLKSLQLHPPNALRIFGSMARRIMQG